MELFANCLGLFFSKVSIIAAKFFLYSKVTRKCSGGMGVPKYTLTIFYNVKRVPQMMLANINYVVPSVDFWTLIIRPIFRGVLIMGTPCIKKSAMAGQKNTRCWHQSLKKRDIIEINYANRRASQIRCCVKIFPKMLPLCFLVWFYFAGKKSHT